MCFFSTANLEKWTRHDEFRNYDFDDDRQPERAICHPKYGHRNRKYLYLQQQTKSEPYFYTIRLITLYWLFFFDIYD